MAKLTLSVDDDVIARAKRYAEARGTSVSAIVERMLDRISQPLDDVELTPMVARLRGIAKGADPEDYYRYLERKYR
ncbi:MAG TPA: DUF6364 family protein [Thermoanaerobaculia bacterium]|jgi:hypothetical protein|nr:DUF6364 family protein [Thermoanaerobaculia bacterium]